MFTPSLFPPSLPQDTSISNADTYPSTLPISTPPIESTSLPRQSIRLRKSPTYLQDYHCNLLSTTTVTKSPISDTPYPLSSVISYAHLSSSHKHFSLTIFATSEPKTYYQVVKHDC